MRAVHGSRAVKNGRQELHENSIKKHANASTVDGRGKPECTCTATRQKTVGWRVEGARGRVQEVRVRSQAEKTRVKEKRRKNEKGTEQKSGMLLCIYLLLPRVQ